MARYFLYSTVLFVLSGSCTPDLSYTIDGELQQWHKITLTFDGPEAAEDQPMNPFTDYRLNVRFSNGDKQFIVPGYFAADGQAGESSTTSGNKWRVHFNPDEIGDWQFEVSFRQGTEIAILDDPEAGTPIGLDGISGQFTIRPSDKTGKDFRASGRIEIDSTGRYFQFAGSKKYFLKAGADSPENFLAFHEFDGTYRHLAEARQGEADPTESLHRYAPHLADWEEGDPVWQSGKGKAIIGALNYLAGKGMNAVYFLVMNINGDGKDVWPYTAHDQRTRFDCSKLDQWEIIFQHMEQQGLLMHLVTQETENERLLDDGNTGPERKLFYRELIARFGHHNGLVWNLGEENGPANFSPNGQTTEQRMAMSSYLKQHDPYQHPVVLHTHSGPHQKDEILTELLGFEDLDGLSFQVDRREMVHDELIRWADKSRDAGHQWLIGMDEIGFWHTGVVPDTVNPTHDSIRTLVLWGSLMAGGAGVEWYFGARYPHNDLTCEDWRSRDRIWDQTRFAKDFFNTYLPYPSMRPADELVSGQAYCFAKKGDIYAVYFSDGLSGDERIDLQNFAGRYVVLWFDPLNGGSLQNGSIREINDSGQQNIGLPPTAPNRDWVVLISKT